MVNCASLDLTAEVQVKKKVQVKKEKEKEKNITSIQLCQHKTSHLKPPGLVPEWYPGLSALSSSGVRSPYKPITQQKKKQIT